MARIFVSNLGCKLNQAEVEAFARRFEADGHTMVGSLGQADVHLVNSCTVTHAAARDSRKVARRGARQTEVVRTVLTGCYATGSFDEAVALDGVSLVVPNAQKDDLVTHLYSAFPDLDPRVKPCSAAGQILPQGYAPLAFGNTRGAIKVEDGCNMTCSFCIIPSTRGRQRSRCVAEVVTELEDLVGRGYQEIVVTGVQISSYRDGDRRLVNLVQELLERTEVPRLRLSSIAPWQFDPALLDLWPNARLCRHFHLSLQSGANSTLCRMRRPYTSSQYLELVERIRERIDGVAITTDVIVGFPGETEEEFTESLEFVERVGFARTHVFPYSERPGTRSSDLADDVHPTKKKARVNAMREIGASNAAAYARSQVGSVLSVLWERELGGDGSSLRQVVGTSDNYLKVHGTLPVGMDRRVQARIEDETQWPSDSARVVGSLGHEVAHSASGEIMQVDVVDQVEFGNGRPLGGRLPVLA